MFCISGKGALTYVEGRCIADIAGGQGRKYLPVTMQSKLCFSDTRHSNFAEAMHTRSFFSFKDRNQFYTIMTFEIVPRECIPSPVMMHVKNQTATKP